MIERLKEMDKQPDITPEVVKHEPEVTEAKDKRDAIIKKIMELLKKKKDIKKEVTTAKTNDPKHNANILGQINKIPGEAKEELRKAFNKGKTIDIPS
jgi:hypothetical protein